MSASPDHKWRNTILAGLANYIDAGSIVAGAVDGGNGLIRLTPTEPAIVERIRLAVEQSLQIVEKRVNQLGTVEPSIQRQGLDRILVHQSLDVHLWQGLPDSAVH